MQLKTMWFAPPMAIARVGSSSVPMAAFSWGESDISARGSGRTSLMPRETIVVAREDVVAEDGVVVQAGTPHLENPTKIVFRDDEGIRPVAPFFELHADWIDDSGRERSGEVTYDLLEAWGAAGPEALTFQLKLANLKAYHYTYKPGDRVEAAIEGVSAKDHKVIPLEGRSPKGAEKLLVPEEKAIPLGTLQVLRPTAELPEVRLRFTPPAGLVYAPSNLNDQIEKLPAGTGTEWQNFTLDSQLCILNPDAAWARWEMGQSDLPPFARSDSRNNPGGLLAAVGLRSLGLIDDLSDGVLTAELQIGSEVYTALARVVVGPPDFSPSSRTPVSLADNLIDREGRGTMRNSEWPKEEMTEIVRDIFERAFETSDLMHRDYQNWRSTNENRRTLLRLGGNSPFDAEDVAEMMWPVSDDARVEKGTGDPLALSHEGTRKHRRYVVLEYLEDRFRENPGLFEEWIRRPVDPNPFFDRRMPALMRGSDGRPFHLTRWQWELIRRWIRSLSSIGPVKQDSNVKDTKGE